METLNITPKKMRNASYRITLDFVNTKEEGLIKNLTLSIGYALEREQVDKIRALKKSGEMFRLYLEGEYEVLDAIGTINSITGLAQRKFSIHSADFNLRNCRNVARLEKIKNLEFDA